MVKFRYITGGEYFTSFLYLAKEIEGLAGGEQSGKKYANERSGFGLLKS